MRPENVRIQTRDGITIPCELEYAGVFNGIERWNVMTRLQDGDTILCDALHPKTEIAFPVNEDIRKRLDL